MTTVHSAMAPIKLLHGAFNGVDWPLKVYGATHLGTRVRADPVQGVEMLFQLGPNEDHERATHLFGNAWRESFAVQWTPTLAAPKEAAETYQGGLCYPRDPAALASLQPAHGPSACLFGFQAVSLPPGRPIVRCKVELPPTTPPPPPAPPPPSAAPSPPPPAAPPKTLFVIDDDACALGGRVVFGASNADSVGESDATGGLAALWFAVRVELARWSPSMVLHIAFSGQQLRLANVRNAQLIPGGEGGGESGEDAVDGVLEFTLALPREAPPGSSDGAIGAVVIRAHGLLERWEVLTCEHGVPALATSLASSTVDAQRESDMEAEAREEEAAVGSSATLPVQTVAKLLIVIGVLMLLLWAHVSGAWGGFIGGLGAGAALRQALEVSAARQGATALPTDDIAYDIDRGVDGPLDDELLSAALDGFDDEIDYELGGKTPPCSPYVNRQASSNGLSMTLD